MQYLYLIRSSEYCKIGVASDVRSRLATLQTGNPNALVVVSCWEFPNAEVVERCLHQRFDSVRKRGEWFSMSAEELVEADEDILEFEVAKSNSWNFEKMHADGWYMEKANSKGINDRYWAWRRGVKNKEYIYGGKISDLPLSFEEMRKKYKK